MCAKQLLEHLGYVDSLQLLTPESSYFKSFLLGGCKNGIPEAYSIANRKLIGRMSGPGFAHAHSIPPNVIA